MDHLPPAPIPPRPDLVEIPWRRARRFPRWVIVVSGVLAIGLALAAVAPLFDVDDRPRGPGFHFLARTDEGSPTRWNPCEPIHYVVNASLAPSGSIMDVHEAVRRVSAATGIPFEYEGPTDEEASIERAVYQPDRYGLRWAPVLITWADPNDTDIPFEHDGEVAAGVAVPVIPPARVDDVYVSGWIALNADDPNPPGFDLPGQQGPVLQHELGHLMGLGHVNDLTELMHPSGGNVVDFGPGDLEGLRLLGAAGGCVPVLDPLGA